ncbi:hypothetical protein J7E26_12000 [Bacillus sp. ISL-51]|uniref:contact-dependent growth inhibition system immunity protein n=1 Tax=Bacteria TaxID=2 RepID=UPI001BE912C4|nr:MULTISPECIES: contact-dependent growth inhibition system immunity protein [Bacteria]MBT2574674.1 hypothetical protein [Bacillus sp. ISL-51]MBT2636239.1 hypothetical protein [Bacillus sp. ISL-26]MBT2711289.1 hypothetical protein [Pseudomonas sp. ISL-88]
MEKLKNESVEEVRSFLSCYFHQDYDSMESVYEELLNEESVEYLIFLVPLLRNFINSDWSIEDKSTLIDECADGVYFPYYEMSPLDWLKQVTKKIELYLNI